MRGSNQNQGAPSALVAFEILDQRRLQVEKIAEALAGKKIILLPLSGSGMDIKTTNMNKLLETYGLQKLTQENKDGKD